MTLGITVGKFYPFHRGHDYLIQQAKAQVERLVVILAYKPHESIPGPVRAQWIRQLHPEVEVIAILDDLPNAPAPWAQRSLELLQGRIPNFAFTSEDYGDAWAALMGAQHIPVDRQRHHFPISGTQLRADLQQHWAMLTPPAKAYFAQRICVLGVESSGTTTLTQALAAHYQTVWVPEYGRYYWEGRRYTPNAEHWETYEFVQIAQGQQRWEDDLVMQANRLLFCDTDALATHLWHRRYLGHYAPAVEALADRRDYALYLLTLPDFPFVQDGTREGESMRLTMHEWFLDVLTAKQKPFITLGGPLPQRLETAIAAIGNLPNLPILQEP